MFDLDDLDFDDLFDESEVESEEEGDEDDLEFDAEFDVDFDLDPIDRANSWVEQAHSAGLIDAADDCEIDFE